MSKRAEEAALKAYPIKGDWVGNQYGEWDNDINRPKRNTFLQGYEQAEKDLGWHSVDESLPPIDEEVIVLLGEWNEVSIEPLYRIAFGHVVNKKYCEDFNGWNIPGVRYWMPMPEIPKEEKK